MTDPVNRIDLVRPDAPALAAPGPHAVGVRTERFVDPGRLDVLAAKDGEIPRADRALAMEIWYPATLPADTAPRGVYRTVTRAGTPTELVGRAVRGAEPDRSDAPWPLVLISHGYPGNRYLMAHLAEHLASVGYLVAALDHPGSTYLDQGDFGGTMLDRPLDQRAALDELERRAAGGGDFPGDLADVARTGLVGFSMGGYGALNLLGAGFTEAAARAPTAPSGGALLARAAGHPDYDGGPDPRVRALIAAAPWGMNAGVWEDAGLAGLETPTLFVAGGEDDVSGYEDGVAALFERTANAERWLLTFEHARHNVAAIPAPAESWSDGSFDHYADPVWDAVKMNGALQHFATAFFGLHVKGDAAMRSRLELPERASDAWRDFPPRGAVGMTLRHRPAGG